MPIFLLLYRKKMDESTILSCITCVFILYSTEMNTELVRRDDVAHYFDKTTQFIINVIERTQ